MNSFSFHFSVHFCTLFMGVFLVRYETDRATFKTRTITTLLYARSRRQYRRTIDEHETLTIYLTAKVPCVVFILPFGTYANIMCITITFKTNARLVIISENQIDFAYKLGLRNGQQCSGRGYQSPAISRVSKKNENS